MICGMDNLEKIRDDLMQKLMDAYTASSNIVDIDLFSYFNLYILKKENLMSYQVPNTNKMFNIIKSMYLIKAPSFNEIPTNFY